MPYNIYLETEWPIRSDVIHFCSITVHKAVMCACKYVHVDSAPEVHFRTG